MSSDLFGDVQPPAMPAPVAAAPAKTCSACVVWEQDRSTGLYEAACADCKARGIARSPAAWRAVNGITEVDVQSAIVNAFGEANYREGRQLVWSWINKLKVKA